MKPDMRFDELFEQYGKSVALPIPAKIAALRPKPDYRQKLKPLAYKVDPTPQQMAVGGQPRSVRQSKTDKTSDSLPLRIGKEVIRPNDPRYAAIMSLLNRQKSRP